MPHCLDAKIVKEIKEEYKKDIDKNIEKKSIEFML
jgi:hypothetical protein